MDELEDRVRRGLQQHPGASVDATELLADVHRGVRNRQQRRLAVGAAGVLAVLTASGLLTGTTTGPDPATDATTSPAPTASSTAEATAEATAAETSATTGPAAPDAGSISGATGFDVATGTGAVFWVSASSCAGQPCSVLHRAERGAGGQQVRSFTYDDPAEATTYELPPVELVRVGADEQDLWAFGQQLWSSHDGGATWDRQQLPGDDPRGRILVEPVGESVFALQDGGPVRVWRSPVSSDDWTAVPLPGGVEYADHMTSIGETLVVTAFLDDRRVLLLNDAGSDTWRRAEPPCQGETGPVRSSGMILTMPCPAEGDTFARGAQVLVWRSPDGETWTPFAGVRHSSYLDDVFPVDDATAFAVTGEGGLIVTAEGQEQVELPLGKDDSSLSGSFVTPERGYLLVTSPRQLLGTEDGGRTWTRVD